MKYLLIAMLLTGCDAQPLIAPSQNYVIEGLKYHKDKYGICYALYRGGNYDAVMTSIPCEKVEL
jgi:hypothetical protein